MLFDHRAFRGHEQVRFIFDEATGLRAIHAVHRTLEGATIGGIRCRNYGTDEEALADVLHLSSTMTFKAVMADLPIGGAKSVIIADPATGRTPERLAAMGRYIDSLDGSYICAPDVGTTSSDMDIIGRHCRPEFVSGMTGQGGTTAVATALALYQGIRGAAEAVFEAGGLSGLRVAVQGAGNVGRRLAEHLSAAGARVLIGDVDVRAAERAALACGGEVVPAEEILYCDVDILSPNALGGIFSDSTVPRLRAPLICGAANTQLASQEVAGLLHGKGIIWVPDYVASCGGIIVAMQMVGRLSEEGCSKKLKEVYDTVKDLLKRASRQSVSPQELATAKVQSVLKGLRKTSVR